MDFLVIFLSIVNILTSLLVYRKLLGPKLENVQYVFVQPTPTESGSPEPILQEPVVEELVGASAAVDNERYQAWRNVKEEPVKAPIPTHHQPSVPASGPLERPYGFSR